MTPTLDPVRREELREIDALLIRLTGAAVVFGSISDPDAQSELLRCQSSILAAVEVLLARIAELEAVEAALAEVEKQWPGSFWLMSKGRLSEKEPLYGFQVLFGTDDVLAEGEGDTQAEAILAALLPKASVREERG